MASFFTAVVSLLLSRRCCLAAVVSPPLLLSLSLINFELFFLTTVYSQWAVPTVTPPPLEVGKCRTHTALSYSCRRLRGQTEMLGN